MAAIIEMDLFDDDELACVSTGSLGQQGVPTMPSYGSGLFAQTAPVSAMPHHSSFPSMESARMVSVDSFAFMQTQAQPVKTVTPYESLKNLVNQKQTMKRPASYMTPSTMQNATFPMADAKPSSFIRQALGNKNVGIASIFDEPSRPMKRTRTSPTLLHEACLGGAAHAVEASLQQMPQAASQQMTVQTTKKFYNLVANKVEERRVNADYAYSLNLALQTDMDSSMIEKILNSAPEVMSQEDGKMRETSLHVLMKHRPNDVATVDLFLLTNPSCVSITDCRLNTPLHIACSKGASLDVIRHMCILCPEAMTQRNFYGHTPIQLAQRSSSCPEDVSLYLLDQLDM